jgi:hypothetical protein
LPIVCIHEKIGISKFTQPFCFLFDCLVCGLVLIAQILLPIYFGARWILRRRCRSAARSCTCAPRCTTCSCSTLRRPISRHSLMYVGHPFLSNISICPSEQRLFLVVLSLCFAWSCRLTFACCFGSSSPRLSLRFSMPCCAKFQCCCSPTRSTSSRRVSRR